MKQLVRRLIHGAVAGAAGTTALNAVTYLDMSVRGRPSSKTPERTVERMAKDAGIQIPGDKETRSNRLDGLGPLTGLVTGVGVGVLASLTGRLFRLPFPLTAAMVGGAAMAATDGSMAALGVTDPHAWSTSAWAADVVPHLAYGAVTVAALDLLDA